MAARAFHERGVVTIWPDDLPNDIERRLVLSLAERLYGKRSATNGATWPTT